MTITLPEQTHDEVPQRDRRSGVRARWLVCLAVLAAAGVGAPLLIQAAGEPGGSVRACPGTSSPACAPSSAPRVSSPPAASGATSANPVQPSAPARHQAKSSPPQTSHQPSSRQHVSRQPSSRRTTAPGRAGHAKPSSPPASAAVTASGAAAGGAAAPPPVTGSLTRALSPTSWWNAPLPDAAPVNPQSRAILDYMRTAPDNGGGYLHLTGAAGSSWGQPAYWATSADPEYAVHSLGFPLPPEFGSLRIPANARPASTSDSAMVVYDVTKGYVVTLWHAVRTSTGWSAGGGSVAYLHSNGYSARTGRSDDPRNGGSMRGNNGAVSFAQFNEVAAGSIDHVLKIALGPDPSSRFLFPMVGSDGRGPASAPAEGTRLRIKASVNLAGLKLNPQALIIARAAQRYGVYIGDGGGNTTLKLENTAFENRGQLWTLSSDALAGLPFTDQIWDVVADNYGR
jgi:hypothetical protein